MTRLRTTVAKRFEQGHRTDLVAWGLGFIAVVLLLVDTFASSASRHLGRWGIAVGLVALGTWLAPARRPPERRGGARDGQLLEQLVDRAEKSVDELDRRR